MRVYSIIGLATISALLIGCQSNSFKIKGHIAGLSEGDTLILINDVNSVNSDRPHGEKIAIDKNGNFEYKGTADSTERCVLYNAKGNYNYYDFFREPGTSLNMSLYSESVHGNNCNSIKGSKLNDALTAIAHSVDKIQKEIVHLSNGYPINRLGTKEQNRIKLLEQRMRTIIIHGINDNIQNELGYYLLTSYCQGWDINENVISSLIHSLPKERIKRPEMVKLISNLRTKSNAAVGKLITGFQMLSPEGEGIYLYKEIKKNKITIIDFWASWCEPCRTEMPDMVNLYKTYHPKGLGIIGISLDSNADSWKKSIKDLKMTWVQMSDLQGWESVGAQGLGITSIPFTIIVDSNGVILNKNLRGQELENFIKENI